jgi:hypothetical protein
MSPIQYASHNSFIINKTLLSKDVHGVTLKIKNYRHA